MNTRPYTPNTEQRTDALKAGLTLLSLFATSTLFAQAPAATAADDTNNKDEVIALNAFTVSTSKDVGYAATNSIGGTRTNTPIKDIPLNIQVFTKELADDLIITNQVDLEPYNASLVYGSADRASDNPIQQPYQQFLFRGFRQNWGLRDGVREYDPIDGQGLARVELVKGGAAPLYGLSYPGGVMNSITKAVDFSRNFTGIRLTGGGEGDYRGSLDTNVSGTLAGNQKVGVRFNGAYARSEDYRAHSAGYTHYGSVNVAYEPTPTTKIEFLAEQGTRAKPQGLGLFTASDSSAGNPGNGNQASIPLQILRPDIPWDWNWSNGKNMDVLDTKLYRATITQAIGEQFAVTGYIQASSRLEQSTNGWDVNNGSGSGWDQVNNRIASTYNYRDWGNNMHAYGATGVYKLDVAGVKNTFAFGANVWAEKELSRNNAPLNPLASIIYYPVKADVATNVPPFAPTDVVPIWLGIPDPNHPGQVLYNGGNGYHRENNSNDYYFVNWQASLLEDKLKVNLGVNYTRLKTIAWNSGASGVPDNIYTASKYSPLFGALYQVTKEVSVFGNHSTSLFPDSTKDSFGHQFSPQVGSSWEGGVKVELLDGKISGSVSYFQIAQTGGTQNDPNKPNANTLIYDGLTAAQQQVQFGGIRPIGDIVSGGRQEAKGVDIDLTFQPIRQLQIQTTYEHVDHKFVTSAIASTIGQTWQNAIRDRFSLLGKYSFTDGPAKGLWVGLGVSGGARSLQDYQQRAPNGGVYSGSGPFIEVARFEPGRIVVDLFTGYRYKIFGYQGSVQFNVHNLTETTDYAGWVATGNANVLATERYKVPLHAVYRLTVGVDF